MAEKKPEGAAPGGEIVQRYRFRVRTADGRELVSQVATVTRPAPLRTSPAQVEQTPAAAAAAAEQAAAALPVAMADVPVHLILVSVKGQRQGELHVDPGFRDAPGTAPKHQFSIQEFSYSVVSPRDPQSGLPTGKRMHQPIVFAKELGPSTPQLYTAFAGNENLPEVVFDCYGTDAGGQQKLAHTVKLTNASIASIEYHQLDLRVTELQKIAEFALVALAFQKAELTHGALSATDDWAANA